ncbi:MAG: hypothetical protein K8E66_07050 [Phycisphaerales bacterium]|nr:hypothetical protein [Phycisphaerales bacterium]
MRRPASVHFAAVILIAVLAAWTHRVWGEAQTDPARPHRVATVDMLELLEDLLQTGDFKPDRDEFRGDWEERIGVIQNALAQIEGEMRMASPNDPGARQLQQRYQQTGYQFQQMQRQASMEFDRFSAEQAATAYSTLHTEASMLANELGYSHLIASRGAGEITDRSNLATVTQEILARSMIISPAGDDLTARLRERLSIPVRPEPTPEAEMGEIAPGTDMPEPAADQTPTAEGDG